MSLKEYLSKICFIIFGMLIIFPVTLNIITVIINFFINPTWDFINDIIIWPIVGTLMWISELLELKKVLLILLFLIPFILSTYRLQKLRNFYFISFYVFLISLIISGRSLYYYLLNQNNTIHLGQLIAGIISILISSIIFYRLLKKHLWETM